MMKTCLSVAILLALTAYGDAFNVGIEERFSFSNVVHVGNARNATIKTGYHIRATVIVGAVWGDDEVKLLKIKIVNPTVLSIPENKAGHFERTEQTFYALWNSGHIRSIHFLPSDASIPVRNFKKAIAALFQYQLMDGTFEEDDPSGRCLAKYISHSSTRYHKFKSDCQYHAKRIEREEYPLRSSINTSRSAEFTVSSDGALQKVISQDYVKYMLNAQNQLGAYYESIMRLDVEENAQQIDILEGSSLKDIMAQLDLDNDTLVTNSEHRSGCGNDQCDEIIEMFKQYRKSLLNDNIGKKESSSALVALVNVARTSTTEVLRRLLETKTSFKFKGQLMDLLGAAQTLASHNAAKPELKYDSDEELFLSERYLQALAIGTRPRKEIIEDLLEMAQKETKSEKFADSLIQCLASMTRCFALLEEHSYESVTVKKVVSFFTERLKICRKDPCKLKYIRGLHNLKCPESADLLVNLAQEGSSTVSVAAMKALRSFSVYLWNDEFRAKFEDIFFQVSKPYDSSARILALDILLDSKPNYLELAHLVQFLKSKDKAYELKQYLLQKLRLLSAQCSDFAVILEKVIESDHSIKNYHVLGPRGLSTALSRTFSTNPSFNASLTSLQEMKGGVLKRGIVDLTLDVTDERTSLFTLGLYTGGLSSFASNNGDDSDGSNDDEETIGGMELSVQGTVMRPLQFFNGKGELMGHIWSGTASEPTPAYQATTLLQDNEEIFPTHNGGTLKLTATGAISIDLNGQVSISIWSQKANCKVEQNTAITMAGELSLDTLFASSAVRFSANQEPKLHLSAALDFSGDPALCMQLSQPSSHLELLFERSILLKGTTHPVIQKTSKTYHLNGLTHALNRKNSEMCNLIEKV
ncbi:microsomal triacylglycerol transfer protein [Anopheles cruzii]|uniref:microsomal triacylglycerol transfer protein n=1 Tax=Anopheles cruzii TaxID=68878 RepID=UPI0022EC68BE|nr:microsomal triacylglycerol transfer protein [Anopheles cruzii]